MKCWFYVYINVAKGSKTKESQNLFLIKPLVFYAIGDLLVNQSFPQKHKVIHLRK